MIPWHIFLVHLIKLFTFVAFIYNMFISVHVHSLMADYRKFDFKHPWSCASMADSEIVSPYNSKFVPEDWGFCCVCISSSLWFLCTSPHHQSISLWDILPPSPICHIIIYSVYSFAYHQVAKKPKRQLSEQELVHDEIEREVSTCKCRSQFKVEKVDTGKYRV